MNAFKQIATAAVVLFSLAVQAQKAVVEIAPLPPENVPESGTFWLAQGPNGEDSPPYPYPPLGLDVPIYALGRGQFLVDNSEGNDDVLLRGLMALPAMTTMSLEFPGEEEGGGGEWPEPIPDPRRNSEKFMNQAFSLLDTNTVALTDTNLYNALLGFPDDTNTAPTLQIAPFGTDSVLIKASHFDYSAESIRDFALLVCDKMETPVWKEVDLAGATDGQDGWLVQGIVPNWQVTDVMFLQVSNIARDCNAFFRAIPYSGPEVVLSGAQPYDVVSNTIPLHAGIIDLSGVTNVQFELNVDGLPARYSLGAGNTISLNTKYNPNGLANLYAIVGNNNARIYDPTHLPNNTKLFFSGMGTLPLDFESDTYLLWASDYCSTDSGTNYFYFVTSAPQTITASIFSPSDGRVVKSFSGYVPYPATIYLAWNFTEADGVTEYSNETYAVTFQTSNPTTLTFTNHIDRGIRLGRGCLLTYQWENPADTTGAYLNTKADQVIKGDLLTLFVHISDPFFGLTQYSAGEAGTARHLAVCDPYDSSNVGGWQTILAKLTNSVLSELTIAGAHGSGGWLGGGDYLTNMIDALELQSWVIDPKPNWRLRKANLFSCYSGNLQLATAGGNYPTWADACGIRPTSQQANSVMYKNCGLFFGGMVPQGGFGIAIGQNKTTAEVAQFLDQTWVCGKYQYPGGCEPVYSYDFAINATRGMYPELDKANPLRGGFGLCIYTSNYDAELRDLDTSHVKTQ